MADQVIAEDDALRAARVRMVAEAAPKGPRERIREALSDDPDIASDVITRLDENAGLDDDLGNGRIVELDREFPDDVELRHNAREVVQGLENRFHIEATDPYNDAHEYAIGRLRVGRTDTDTIVDGAAAYRRGVAEIEEGTEQDRTREKKALSHYHDRIDEEFPESEHRELRSQGYELAANYAVENSGRGDGALFQSV